MNVAHHSPRAHGARPQAPDRRRRRHPRARLRRCRGGGDRRRRDRQRSTSTTPSRPGRWRARTTRSSSRSTRHLALPAVGGRAEARHRLPQAQVGAGGRALPRDVDPHRPEGRRALRDLPEGAARLRDVLAVRRGAPPPHGRAPGRGRRPRRPGLRRGAVVDQARLGQARHPAGERDRWCSGWTSRCAQGFLARRVRRGGAHDPRHAHTYFDGTEEHGRLPLEVWEDNFTRTFQIKDYQLAKGVTC